MNGANAIILAGVAAVLGFWLVRKPISSDYVDPGYMYNNPANEEILHSTDNDGGTFWDEIKPPMSAYAGGIIESGPGFSRNRREEIGVNYPTFTGGTFLRPEFLPPVRTAKIQAGRFIHPEYLR